ncbi:Uncharacterised protein [Mycobacterium tuberculosis]|nr:Uncharacterised protein [Mycobacterium tuberculosis]
MPGSTTQVRFSTSREMILFRYFEVSSTMPLLTVWPHCEVPPPRGVTMRPSSRAIAIARSASSTVRGTTTANGLIW